jgi:hypothetical protein
MVVILALTRLGAREKDKRLSLEAGFNHGEADLLPDASSALLAEGLS